LAERLALTEFAHAQTRRAQDRPSPNARSNIYVLIDEARGTTGGDLGNFLMAGLPSATFIGFTGTPVDKNRTLLDTGIDNLEDVSRKKALTR
jgi:type I site-specific restriction-modification system R (restriction) subunit